MNHIESKIQMTVIEETDRLFNLRYRDFLVHRQNKNKTIDLIAPIYKTGEEGWKSIQAAHRSKKMGTRSGVPDLFLAVPRGSLGGLYIELKLPKGKTTPNQAEWISYLVRVGYGAIVCRSVQQSIDAIIKYMEQ